MITDRLDMTSAVDRGRKALTQPTTTPDEIHFGVPPEKYSFFILLLSIPYFGGSILAKESKSQQSMFPTRPGGSGSRSLSVLHLSRFPTIQSLLP